MCLFYIFSCFHVYMLACCCCSVALAIHEWVDPHWFLFTCPFLVPPHVHIIHQPITSPHVHNTIPRAGQQQRVVVAAHHLQIQHRVVVCCFKNKKTKKPKNNNERRKKSGQTHGPKECGGKLARYNHQYSIQPPTTVPPPPPPSYPT